MTDRESTARHGAQGAMRHQRTQESPRQLRAQAKRDPTEWHGHRIVTETDLGAVFEEDDAERRRRMSRRRIRHGVVLVLLVGLLAAGVFLAVGLARGDISIGASEPTPTPTSTCPAGPFDYQDPSAITVNVYNSTSIDGLAGAAADQLRGRAFAVRDIGNRQVDAAAVTAVIVSGEGGRANAFTLQRTLPGSVYRADEREDRSVDVIVGSSFAGLVPPEGVDITPAGLSCAPEPGATPTPVAP
ncbi:LytR C-terminal domain-containing protein [Arthrobacter ruber]|uniref:LytR C-terminal domain-containing protein n=1 Tax=Arthrobacter ruber TaxID=1258893 RepID=UPI001F0CA9F5|nr:LytR C-terminal domain-containing protein [Arthrobacter ruber]